MSLDIFKGWVLKDREDRFEGLPVPPMYICYDNRQDALRGFNEAVQLEKLPPDRAREIVLYHDGEVVAKVSVTGTLNFYAPTNHYG